MKSSFTRGLWRLEWEHHGEGYNGDYDDQCPDDKPLLRAHLYFQDIMCEEGSCCTLAPVGTSEETLKKFSDDLFDKLTAIEDNEVTVDEEADEVRFPARIMQEWTWRTEP